MAIKIPIITLFDNKGLKAAQYQLNKVSGNLNNLTRNFAVAGAAFGAVGFGLSKAVGQASDLQESVNALNVAFGDSAAGIIEFGKSSATSMGVSTVAFNNAAVRFSAFADRIVGSGGDTAGFIADISTRAADFASVFNIDVAEALGVFQSGLAGEAEPLKRFGINLLDSEVKAYAAANGIGEVGRQLTETEKVQARYGLLMEATNKTSGDFANTSDGLANGMRILKAEFTNAQAGIGNALLPAIEGLIPLVRDLANELGPKIQAAVEAVDWVAFGQSIADVASFFVENFEIITKVVATLWALNTIYNTLRVAIGLYNGIVVITNALMSGTALAANIATGALTLFRAALLMSGIGAVIIALGFIVEGISKTHEGARQATPVVTSFGTALLKSGQDAEWAAGKYGIATTAIENLANASSATAGRTSVLDDYAYNLTTGQPVPKAKKSAGVIPDPLAGAKAATKKTVSGVKALNAQLAKEVKKQKAFVRLTTKKGLSEGLASQILGGTKPLKTAAKIVQGTQKAANKLQNIFQGTAAGKAEIAQKQAVQDRKDEAAAQIRNERIQKEADDLKAAQEKAAQLEQQAIAERQRIYESFANSVKNSFASIKESILGAFDITKFGSSTSSITRNLDKLLTKAKSFSQNLSKLNVMGIDPTLLQQLISAGPLAGAKLAESLVAGGVSGISAIGAGYAELNRLSSEIATTGTNSMYGTSAQQNIYNISVDGGVGSGATIGQAIVEAIKSYERTSGAVWQGA
jgi:hypothetical protein